MPYIDEVAAELVELRLKHRGKTVVVDIIADRPNGITIGDCAFVNKKVDRALEKRQWFGEDYVVEVASPGLDRPLETPKDFSRVIGRKVRIHLLEAVEGKVEHHGDIMEVKEDKISIKTKDKTISIPLKIISTAVQMIE
ncbi:MAG: hypothetical protein JW847_07160 [Candidatus Omnitrophica bacterium]|nr:hypothetical protein [Candidatus Omnitrophota bacterium]